jgi:hypothetical protein
MSREQGPHEMGMRPAAIAAGRRGHDVCSASELTEAAA